ncbi:uncharacterized protein METZ01_LOCUS448191, partial [marine metagenome]
MNLSDGLLKALDTKPKFEKKIETTNAEAYEFYLKAKHKYEKRKNMDDTVIIQGLLQKAIELDDNLIIAKTLFCWTYLFTGETDKALDILVPTLKQVESLGNKHNISEVLAVFQYIYYTKGKYEKALEIITRMLKIEQELKNESGFAYCYNAFAGIYYDRGDYDESIAYYKRANKISIKFEKFASVASNYHNIALIHYQLGNFHQALKYAKRSIKLNEKKLGHKHSIATTQQII